MDIFKKIAQIAKELDTNGYHKEADEVTQVLEKFAQTQYNNPYLQEKTDNNWQFNTGAAFQQKQRDKLKHWISYFNDMIKTLYIKHPDWGNKKGNFQRTLSAEIDRVVEPELKDSVKKYVLEGVKSTWNRGFVPMKSNYNQLSASSSQAKKFALYMLDGLIYYNKMLPNITGVVGNNIKEIRKYLDTKDPAWKRHSVQFQNYVLQNAGMAPNIMPPESVFTTLGIGNPLTGSGLEEIRAELKTNTQPQAASKNKPDNSIDQGI
jgi:hypothetical protein